MRENTAIKNQNPEDRRLETKNIFTIFKTLVLFHHL